MEKQKKVKCGEVYFYDFGRQKDLPFNGLRPVLVIQGNKLNNYSLTTLVAAIVPAVEKRYLSSHIVIGEICGLEKPSMVLLEQVSCVNQSALGAYIGVIKNDATKKAIQCGLKKVFGLCNCTPRGNADVRCLCRKCLQDYIQSNRYIVKRLDPFTGRKEHCDKCDSLGYDYILVSRRNLAKSQGYDLKIRTFDSNVKNE